MVITSLSNSASADDSYMAGIELSNSCRRLYLDRQKATESFKESLSKSEQKGKTSLDSAMNHLRKEMAGLMDQDLSFMEQLLTMNEKIEELKFQTYHAVKEDFDSSTSLVDIPQSHAELTESTDLRVPSNNETDSGLYDSCSSIFEDAEDFCVVETCVSKKYWKSLHSIKHDSIDSGYEDDAESSDDCSSDVESH